MHTISILITFQLHQTDININNIHFCFFIHLLVVVFGVTPFRHSLTCIFYLSLITTTRYVMLLPDISELQILIKMSYLLKLIHHIGLFIFVWISDYCFNHITYFIIRFAVMHCTACVLCTSINNFYTIISPFYLFLRQHSENQVTVLSMLH